MHGDWRQSKGSWGRVHLLVCLLLGGIWADTQAAGKMSLKPLKVSGSLYEERDISAMELVGKWLYVAADEGRDLQRLSGDASAGFRQPMSFSLKDGKSQKQPSKGDEFDLEAMAYDGKQRLYVIGSHSAKRAQLDGRKSKSLKATRKHLASVQTEPARRVLFRVPLDAEGRPDGRPEKVSLWKAINGYPLLKPFTRIPSKENGIDIEGLAVAGDRLYVGFRGPVLRDNWVPVLVGRFEEMDKGSRIKFIRLDGLGIRSMLSLGRQGFLILAGPVGEGPGGFHLYHWDGKDQLPAKDGERGKVRHLGEVPVNPGYKPEAMTLVSQQGRRLQLLLAFDGANKGAMSLLELGL